MCVNNANHILRKRRLSGKRTGYLSAAAVMFFSMAVLCCLFFGNFRQKKALEEFSFYVCDNQGKLLYYSSNKGNSYKGYQEDINKIWKGICKEGEEPGFQRKKFGGEDCRLFCRKLNDGCIAVMTIPEEACFSKMAVFFGISAGCLGVCSGAAVLVVQMHKQEQHIRGKGKKRRKRRHFAELYENTVKSAASLCQAMYYVDLTEGTYCRVYPDMGENDGSVKQTANLFLGQTIHEEDRKELESYVSTERIRKELKEQDKIEIKYRHKTGNDVYEWCLLSITAAKWRDGIPEAAAAVIRNVDAVIRCGEEQREQLQRRVLHAETANKAKSEFLSSMSHDIRTPMNAILGMAEVAAMYIEDRDRVTDALDKIKNSGKHLLGLINCVLDMSKIESGRITLEETEFNLADIIEEVLALFCIQMKQKNLELCVNLDGLKQKEVIGDAQRLQQVFVNIMGNAVKFTPDGGTLGLCICELPSETEEYGYYEFIFEDTGIGMEQAFVDKIFEPFERAEDSRVSVIEGSGLGMSIVRNSVRMMGGDIKVESTLGKGSKFTVGVHLKQNWKNRAGLPQCERNRSELASSREKEFAGRRVLLVEDNVVNIEVGRELLGAAGIETDVAVNGQEAVEKMRTMPAESYDLVLMDVQMPVKNGYDAAREIRASRREDLKQIPIIAMTADAFRDDVEKAIKSGMNGHISKPVDTIKLNHVLKEWIGS